MKKRGMFMSIELLVVSIVVISLIVLASFAVIKLKKTSSVMSIINESRGYLEAVVNFKTSIGYWPGNVPSNILSKDNRFLKSVIYNEQIVSSVVDPTGLCKDSLGTNGEVSPALFDSAANPVLSNLNKTSLSFRQMAKAGFISKDKADFTVSGFGLCADKRFTSGFTSSAYYKNGIFPRSNYDSNLVWWFEVVSSDPYRARLGWVKGSYPAATPNSVNGTAEATSRLIPVAFDAYKEYWQKFYANAPLLMLVQPTKPKSIANDGTDRTNITAPTSWLPQGYGMGGISPDLAQTIDQKISNGMPFRYSGAGAGRVTATHGNWQYGNNCFKKADGTNLGGPDAASSSSPSISYTLDDLNNAVYNIKSNTKDSSDSCIMIFAGAPSAM